MNRTEFFSSSPSSLSAQEKSAESADVFPDKPLISPHARREWIITYFKSKSEYTDIMKKVIDVRFSNLVEYIGRQPNYRERLEYYWIHARHQEECYKLFELEMNLLVPGFLGKTKKSFEGQQLLSKVLAVAKPLVKIGFIGGAVYVFAWLVKGKPPNPSELAEPILIGG
jgi:hypothetical protein